MPITRSRTAPSASAAARRRRWRPPRRPWSPGTGSSTPSRWPVAGRAARPARPASRRPAPTTTRSPASCSTTWSSRRGPPPGRAARRGAPAELGRRRRAAPPRARCGRRRRSTAAASSVDAGAATNAGRYAGDRVARRRPARRAAPVARRSASSTGPVGRHQNCSARPASTSGCGAAVPAGHLAAQPRRREDLARVGQPVRVERAPHQLHRVQVVGGEHPRHVLGLVRRRRRARR